MRSRKELMGAATGLLVLGILMRGASYGYEIVETINREADGLLSWREGTVYPILHKLEAEGLVRAQWQETPHGRNRKYYSITARGRSSLRSDRKDFANVSKMVLGIVGGPNV